MREIVDMLAKAVKQLDNDQLGLQSNTQHFEDLVGEIMLDWNSETKVKEVLTDCYIDGILYSPRFNGDKWSWL